MTVFISFYLCTQQWSNQVNAPQYHSIFSSTKNHTYICHPFTRVFLPKCRPHFVFFLLPTSARYMVVQWQQSSDSPANSVYSQPINCLLYEGERWLIHRTLFPNRFTCRLRRNYICYCYDDWIPAISGVYSLSRSDDDLKEPKDQKNTDG
jgi:hypothetical protein